MKNIRLQQDIWLSDLTGIRVYRIDASGCPGDRPIASQPERVQLDATMGENPVFIYAKPSVTEHAFIKWLANSHFNLVDTNIQLDKRIVKARKKTGRFKVRFADPTDEAQTVELARRAFRFSRFHLDPQISENVANTIKAEWTRNYFLSKRGDAMVVAEKGGEIVGFALLIFGRNHNLIIDLLAVDAHHRRNGIASEMISFVENHHGDYQRISAGTQIGNIHAARMYEKAGFQLCSAQYVFHYHH